MQGKFLHVEFFGIKKVTDQDEDTVTVYPNAKLVAKVEGTDAADHSVALKHSGAFEAYCLNVTYCWERGERGERALNFKSIKKVEAEKPPKMIRWLTQSVDLEDLRISQTESQESGHLWKYDDAVTETNDGLFEWKI